MALEERPRNLQSVARHRDMSFVAAPLGRKYLPTALAQNAECLDSFLSPFSFQPLMVEALAGYVILYDELVEANIPRRQGRQVPWIGDAKNQAPTTTSPMCEHHPTVHWPQSHACAEG